MADAREQFLSDVKAYIVAGDRLVAAVAHYNEMNREALADLESGMSMSESFARRDSASWSRNLASVLDEFETCRRATRESAAAGLMEEGRTVTDVGRAFGVSHQLASRFARGIHTPTDGDADRASAD